MAERNMYKKKLRLKFNIQSNNDFYFMIDCGENCLMCTSPTKCTKCIPSMLLYQGLCVAHCGQGQFEDGATMSCKG